MKRSAFAPALALLLCATFTASVLAQQATPAASTSGTPPAATRAKFATPVKGEAVIQVIAGNSKVVGKEIVTTYKVKNMASGPIAMLKIDEYWYAKGGVLASTADARWRQPFQPGEVIEITTKAPAPQGNLAELSKRALFSHANGKVSVKAVKKFE